jgi:hypothetical protein
MPRSKLTHESGHVVKVGCTPQGTRLMLRALDMTPQPRRPNGMIHHSSQVYQGDSPWSVI